MSQFMDQSRVIKAYRWMLLARTLDERLAQLYRAGQIFGGVFLGKGQEALSVSIGMSLQRHDVFAPLIRDGAGRLAFGETPLDALRTCLGSPLGPMRARDGNVHRGKPKEGYLPMISHLGASISVVNAALMAKRMKGEKHFVGAASIGDGATSTGAFHEALNQAAIERLPLVLVVANNQFAYSTPVASQFACQNLGDRAIGYGVRAHTLDGTDLKSCLEGMREASDLARDGDGPQLVIADLLRLCGHGEHDDAHYVSDSLKASVLGTDCMQLAEQWLREAYAIKSEEFNLWKEEALKEINEGIEQVQGEGSPDPYHHPWKSLFTRELCEHV